MKLFWFKLVQFLYWGVFKDTKILMYSAVVLKFRQKRAEST